MLHTVRLDDTKEDSIVGDGHLKEILQLNSFIIG